MPRKILGYDTEPHSFSWYLSFFGWFNSAIYECLLEKFESHSILGDRLIPCLVPVDSLYVYRVVRQVLQINFNHETNILLIFILKYFVLLNVFKELKILEWQWVLEHDATVKIIRINVDY